MPCVAIALAPRRPTPAPLVADRRSPFSALIQECPRPCDVIYDRTRWPGKPRKWRSDPRPVRASVDVAAANTRAMCPALKTVCQANIPALPRFEVRPDLGMARQATGPEAVATRCPARRGGYGKVCSLASRRPSRGRELSHRAAWKNGHLVLSNVFMILYLRQVTLLLAHGDRSYIKTAIQACASAVSGTAAVREAGCPARSPAPDILIDHGEQGLRREIRRATDFARARRHPGHRRAAPPEFEVTLAPPMPAIVGVWWCEGRAEPATLLSAKSEMTHTWPEPFAAGRRSSRCAEHVQC